MPKHTVQALHKEYCLGIGSVDFFPCTKTKLEVVMSQIALQPPLFDGRGGGYKSEASFSSFHPTLPLLRDQEDLGRRRRRRRREPICGKMEVVPCSLALLPPLLFLRLLFETPKPSSPGSGETAEGRSGERPEENGWGKGKRKEQSGGREEEEEEEGSWNSGRGRKEKGGNILRKWDGRPTFKRARQFCT